MSWWMDEHEPFNFGIRYANRILVNVIAKQTLEQKHRFFP